MEVDHHQHNNPNSSSDEDEDVVHGTFYRAKCASHATSQRFPTGTGASSHLRRVLRHRNLCQERSSSHPRLFRAGDSPASASPDLPTHTLHLEATGRKSRSRLSVHPAMETDAEEEEEEEIIGLSLPRNPLEELDPANLPCNCTDPNCSEQSDHVSREGESSSALYNTLHQEGSWLHSVRARLTTQAGGPAACLKVYQCCLQLTEKQPDILQSASISADGDTILMQLLARSTDSLSNDRAVKLLTSQVLAFVRLYIESGQADLLFARNKLGLGALELAGLADRKDLAEYLLGLYPALGRDPNESNSLGHTVLHMMARKGDDCSETLDRLLSLRSEATGARLLRIDVVNKGGKTPLDVACACEQLFSTGAERTLYSNVIQLFHKVIREETKELFGEDVSFGSDHSSNCSRSNSLTDAPSVEGSGLTFRNF